MTRASDTARLLGAGATILDGTTISTADNTDQLTLLSTDADANVGPNLNLFRNSGSPADDDVLGLIIYNGRNDNSQDVIYARQISYIKDASDGEEDGQLTLQTMVAGTIRDRLNINPTEIVLNEDSQNLDFRVESNGDANMLFVDGGNDRIYMGRNTTDGVGNARLQIEAQDGEAGVSIHRGSASTGGGKIFFSKSRAATAGDDTVVQSGDELGGLLFTGADGTDRASAAAQITVEVDGTPGANDMPGRILFSTTADGASSVTERMRISNAGAVMIGRTATGYSNTGAQFTASGAQNIFVADGDYPLGLNRQSDDGDVLDIRDDGTSVGKLGVAGTRLHIASAGNSGIRFRNDLNCITPCNSDGSNSDNDQNLGQASVRYTQIFATNNSINTSDRNEKQDIEELTDAEKRVAVACKGLMRKYRWKDAVASKGDKARTHFGIIAQDLQDAFTAESLDASKYAMFCSDTWWEKEISVDAVEAVDEVKDEEGNVTTEAVEAKDAYTYIDDKQEATEGYTERTRLGVRYSELLAFIISAI